MTVREALYNSVSFSVGPMSAEVIAVERGLNLDDRFSAIIAKSKEYNLSKADMIKHALMMPNVSEGGVSISFSDRQALMRIANAIYAKYGESLIADQTPTVEFVEW